ncbi:MAG TPA: hypothetical protein VFL86_00095, partial [Burkholderiaceae bacterium]|nr:hypothetical protein [Burkholderiaceae bacterium]
NRGSLAAQGDLQVQAAAIDSASGSLLAAGLAADLKLSGTGRLQLNANELVRAQGQNLATVGLAAQGASIDLAGSDTHAPQVDLQARSGDIDATGATLAAAQGLSAQAAQALRTDRALVTAPQLQVQAHDWSNQGGEVLHTAANALSVSLPGTFDNTGGRLATLSPQVDLSAQAIVNTAGRIEQAGSGTLSLRAGDFSGAGGVLATLGSLDMEVGTARLDGAVTEAGRIRLQAATLSHRDGRLTQTGANEARIDVAGTLDNARGQMRSNGNLAVSAQALANVGGLLQATQQADLQVRVAEGLDNSHGGLDNVPGGLLSAGGQLALSAGQWNNTQGRAEAGRALSAEAGQAVVNRQGSILSGGSLSLAGQSLDNTDGAVEGGAVDLRLAADVVNTKGRLLARQDLALRTGSLGNEAGSVQAAGSLAVQASGAVESTGVLAAQGDTTLQAGRLVSHGVLAAGLRADGTLQGTGALDVVTTGDLQAHGQTLAAGSARLRGAMVDLSGSRSSAQQIDLEATQGGIDTQRASVITDGRLSARAAGLANDAGLLQAGWLDLHLEQLSNVGGTLTQAGTQDSRIDCLQVLNNQGGLIQSRAGSLTLGAATLDNTQGSIQHAGSVLAVMTGTLRGTGGTLMADGALQVQAGAVTFDAARTEAKQLSVAAQTLSNAGGTMLHTGSGTGRVEVGANLDNQRGVILSRGGLAVQAGVLNNAGGQVGAGGGDLAVTVQGGLDNTAFGAILGNHDVRVSAAGIDNRAGMLAGQKGLDLAAASLDNSGGAMQSLQGAVDLRIAGTLRNEAGGQVWAGTDLHLRSAALANAGTLVSQRDMALQVQGSLAHEGAALAGRDLLAQAGSFQAGAASMLAAGLGAFTTHPSGHLRVVAQDTLATQGQLVAATLDLAAATLNLSGARVNADDLSLIARSGGIDASHATLSVRQALAAQTTQVLRTDAAVVSANSLQLQAQHWSNVAGWVEQTGQAAWTVTLPGTLDNSRGVLIGHGTDLRLAAALIGNDQGQVRHAGSGTLALRSAVLDNSLGLLLGHAQVNLEAGLAWLNGGRVDGGQVTLNAGAVSNIGGVIVQSGSGSGAMNLAVAGQLDNRFGIVQSQGDATLAVGSILNLGGEIGSARLRLQASGQVDNQAGLVSGEQALHLAAGSVDNTGGRQQSATGTVDLDVGGRLLNASAVVGDGAAAHVLAGAIVAGTDLHLQAGELAEQARLQAGRDADLQVAGSATHTGGMVAQRHLSLSAESLAASRGSQMAAGVRLDRAPGEAALGGSGDLTVQTQQALSTQGEQLAAGHLQLAGASVSLAGSTSSAQDIRVEARGGDVDASAARLVAGQSLTAQAAMTLRSDRAVLSAQALGVQAHDWSNQAGQVLHWGEGDLQVALPGTLDNRGGTISS